MKALNALQRTVRTGGKFDVDRVAGVNLAALPDHTHDPGLEGKVPGLRVKLEDLPQKALLEGFDERNGPQSPTGKRCAGDRSPDRHASCAVRYAGYILA
ncbi:hypothetical protein [Streptomyces sp. NBC_01579]|uniref:hypothetical protein n=1 Tax=unclassified Streptomyces TaxID=2593676 RepID=UPI00386AE810